MNRAKFKALVTVAVFVAVSFLAACVPTPPPAPAPEVPPVTTPTALQPVAVEHYPQFEDHRGYQDLERSILKSLDYLGRLPANRTLRYGPDRYPVSHIIKSLQAFAILVAAKPSPDTLNAQLKAQYRVYCAGVGPAKNALYTGYYEPLLKGSRTRSAQYPIAIHAKPDDMVEIDLARFASDLKGRRIVGRYDGKTVVPYPTRGQIRNHRDFNSVASPIAWLKDEIDLFVLQIQGSGKVQLPSGELLGIQFHGSNGRSYRSVGRKLIDTGCISAQQMSMQAIRSYLKAHPDKRSAILDHNPRYIFFRQATGDGPLGSLGVPITPYRSLAVDHSLSPSAALAFVTVPMPQVDDKGVIVGWAPYKGFALAQDAGSAIKGAPRADFFMGAGKQAEVAASHLKHSGQLYYLVLNPESAR